MSNEKDGKEESIRPKTQRFRKEEKIESGKKGFGQLKEIEGRKLGSGPKQTVPNGKLKGVARWGVSRRKQSEDYGSLKEEGKNSRGLFIQETKRRHG